MDLFILIVIIPAVLFLLICFSPTTLEAAIKTSPFAATPKWIIRKALKAARLKPGEKLYDLGSGDGRALIIAEKEFKALAVGLEYSRPLFIFSKVNLFLHRIRNAIVLRKDFFKADLSKADVIFAFLTPRAFVKLEPKFKKELKPRTRVVTFSSQLPHWKPKRIIDLAKRETKLYLYKN